MNYMISNKQKLINQAAKMKDSFMADLASNDGVLVERNSETGEIFYDIPSFSSEEYKKRME